MQPTDGASSVEMTLSSSSASASTASWISTSAFARSVSATRSEASAGAQSSIVICAHTARQHCCDRMPAHRLSNHCVLTRSSAAYSAGSITPGQRRAARMRSARTSTR
eukprot:3493713-Prymnesium_polylepis.2